jgi:hypothetical protein
MMQGALDVAKNSLDEGQLLVARIMHVKADLLHCVGDVRTSEGQVLKRTGQTPVLGRISDGGAGGSGQLRRGVHGSRCRVTRAHAGTLKNLESVLGLREEHPVGVAANCETKEVVQLAQVGHGELGAEGGDDSLK